MIFSDPQKLSELDETLSIAQCLEKSFWWYIESKKGFLDQKLDPIDEFL